jgi:Inner membrane protein YgaP-like, transmembrane domain
MKKNVGGIDRLFRFGIGLLSLAIVFATGNIVMQIVFGLVALVGLGTASLGYCPINDKMGLNTAVKKEK